MDCSFRSGLWLILTTIFADVFFRRQFPASEPGSVFVLLRPRDTTLLVRLCGHRKPDTERRTDADCGVPFAGSWARYLAALVLVGLLPIFKLSAALIGCAALAGFLVERVIQRRWKALTEVTVAVAVPAAVAGGVFSSSCRQFIRSSLICAVALKSLAASVPLCRLAGHISNSCRLSKR